MKTPAQVTALALLIALAGCEGADPASLTVWVRTDLVLGQQVVAARTELFDTAPEPSASSPGTRRDTTAASENERELRVASYTIATGSHYVRTRLLGPSGAVVLERIALVDVRGATYLTLIMTRDCRDVMCPQSDPALIACIAGRCVDPRCAPEAPEFCPESMCDTSAECRAEAACAEGSCEHGFCLSRPRPMACAAEEWCHPEGGCLPMSVVPDAGAATDGGAEEDAGFVVADAGGLDAGGADAGETDAGADAGPPDAGPPDAGRPDAGRPDAGRPDAGRPDAGPPPETCDGRDQDLDGSIDEGVCPCPVHQRGGTAYMVCGGARTWTGARDACRASGYELAEIETSAENDFVAARVGAWTWIGHSDRTLEGTWVWTDGSGLTIAPWAAGQPDAGSADEDCGAIRNNALWYDRICSASLPYVCESP